MGRTARRKGRGFFTVLAPGWVLSLDLSAKYERVHRYASLIEMLLSYAMGYCSPERGELECALLMDQNDHDTVTL